MQGNSPHGHRAEDAWQAPRSSGVDLLHSSQVGAPLARLVIISHSSNYCSRNMRPYSFFRRARGIYMRHCYLIFRILDPLKRSRPSGGHSRMLE